MVGSLSWRNYKYSQELFHQKSLLEVEVVYSVSFKCYKVFSLKMKKESPKRCEPPENNKNSSHGKRYKKDIEKEEK